MYERYLPKTGQSLHISIGACMYEVDALDVVETTIEGSLFMICTCMTLML